MLVAVFLWLLRALVVLVVSVSHLMALLLVGGVALLLVLGLVLGDVSDIALFFAKREGKSV